MVSSNLTLRAAAGELTAEGRAAITRLTPWLKNLPTLAGQTEVAVLCSQEFPAGATELAGREVATAVRVSENSASAKFYRRLPILDT